MMTPCRGARCGYGLGTARRQDGRGEPPTRRRRRRRTVRRDGRGRPPPTRGTPEGDRLCLGRLRVAPGGPRPAQVAVPSLYPTPPLPPARVEPRMRRLRVLRPRGCREVQRKRAEEDRRRPVPPAAVGPSSPGPSLCPPARHSPPVGHSSAYSHVGLAATPSPPPPLRSRRRPAGARVERLGGAPRRIAVVVAGAAPGAGALGPPASPSIPGRSRDFHRPDRAAVAAPGGRLHAYFSIERCSTRLIECPAPLSNTSGVLSKACRRPSWARVSPTTG